MTELDLRGIPCPLNFIRTRLALEQVPVGDALTVDLDRGEPEVTVTSGLRLAGHAVTVEPHPDDASAVRLWIQRAMPAAGG
ncbi:MAG: sulfurtransferase TusA family protein [Cyanobacteriota bacterium]